MLYCQKTLALFVFLQIIINLISLPASELLSELVYQGATDLSLQPIRPFYSHE